MASTPHLARGKRRDAQRLLHRFSAELTMPAADPSASRGATLQLVGSPALRSASHQTVALERKDAALLALLASAGATPRASLSVLLWPEADGDGARNNLRQRVFRLRRMADGAVVRLAEGVTHDLDALPARLAVDPQAAPGELLGVLDYGDCPELAAWVEEAREQWRAARRDALAEVAARLEGERQFAAALHYAQRLAAEDPLLEHAHRRVMRLHYLRGDRTAAQAAYERARIVLERELGVPPGRETDELALLIRSGAAALPSPPPATALAALRSPRLVGREPELDRLRTARAAGCTVLLDGEAGIGKTRLLCEFMAQEAAPTPITARLGDARVPYSLMARLERALAQQFGPPDKPWPADELARIAPEFGDPTASPPDALRLRQAIGDALEQWRAKGLALLALDDLHHADEASLELVSALAVASSANAGIVWLLAARSTTMPAALTALPRSTRITLDPLRQSAVEALLASLAIPGFDAAAWAAPLTRHTGGIPRLILETLTAMQSRSPDLRSAGDMVLPVSVTVDQWVASRLERLPAPALKLARLAAIAGQDFSVELAAAVLGQRVLDITATWRELEAAQVLREHGFAHDLIQEATLRSVPAAIARLLHDEVAACLEVREAAPARIAPHWVEAHQFSRAGAQFRCAAADALKASRRNDAAALFEQAATCFERSGERALELEALAERNAALTGSGE